jgi:hypothetical protein
MVTSAAGEVPEEFLDPCQRKLARQVERPQTTLSPDVNGCAVFSKRAEIFLTILASQQAREFRLQCRQRQLFALAERAASRREQGVRPERSAGADANFWYDIVPVCLDIRYGFVPCKGSFCTDGKKCAG